MQHFSSDQVKETLLSTILSLFDRRDEFFTNPLSDFSRTKKISFVQTMLFPMLAGSDNLSTELLEFFEETQLPLPSSIIQRRNQVKPDAFRELLSLFTRRFPPQKTFQGYQLIACDGSRLNLPYNPSDKDTFIKSIKDRRGINQMHLNCLYDLLNDVFMDVELQGVPQLDEKGAFCRLLDRQAHSDHPGKQIFIADRGFACFNVFAHAIHNDQLFLIRAKEAFAKNLCGRLDAPREDRSVSVHIGRHNTKLLRQLENYHYIPANRRYDFLDATSFEADCLQLRILKFPLSEGSFEYIITNLPGYAFSLSSIEHLYNLRWNIETAYRYLKYAGNLVHIHSLKHDFLLQEIYAKLTLYNFAAFVAASVSHIQKEGLKHPYVLNHTQVQKICRLFIRGTVHDVDVLIGRFVVPVRPGRSFQRNLRRQSADTLAYR